MRQHVENGKQGRVVNHEEDKTADFSAVSKLNNTDGAEDSTQSSVLSSQPPPPLLLLLQFPPNCSVNRWRKRKSRKTTLSSKKLLGILLLLPSTTTTSSSTHGIVRQTQGKTPPPPPLPSVLSSSTDGVIPPAPPMMPASQIKSAVTSPLLPQSPSLFEKYPCPHKKLKQLHWEKLIVLIILFGVQVKLRSSQMTYTKKGVLADLEKAFAAREIKSLASKRKEDLQKITFLSRDISQQFGINLHMYSSLSVADLVKKILNCDRDFLANTECC